MWLANYDTYYNRFYEILRKIYLLGLTDRTKLWFDSGKSSVGKSEGLMVRAKGSQKLLNSNEGEVQEQLAQELEDPKGFASYKEVQQWLAAIQGRVVPYKTVHKTVRYALKAKLKRPRPVSEKQQAGAVEAGALCRSVSPRLARDPAR